MFSDNLATMQLARWPLEASLFDGELSAGPVPSLYSVEPDKTEAAIKDNVLKAHWDLNKIAKAFFMAENLTRNAAFEFIKKPRYLYGTY